MSFIRGNNISWWQTWNSRWRCRIAGCSLVLFSVFPWFDHLCLFTVSWNRVDRNSHKPVFHGGVINPLYSTKTPFLQAQFKGQLSAASPVWGSQWWWGNLKECRPDQSPRSAAVAEGLATELPVWEMRGRPWYWVYRNAVWTVSKSSADVSRRAAGRCRKKLQSRCVQGAEVLKAQFLLKPAPIGLNEQRWGEIRHNAELLPKKLPIVLLLWQSSGLHHY